MMKAHLNPFQAAPKAMQAMLALSDHVQTCGLDHTILELVKTRASQINGCAYCLHMHTKDARAMGETEMRLYLLSAWRESPLYNERERAALAWTEALTTLDGKSVSESEYRAMAAQFTPEEQVQLTLAITVINSWNRINVGFHTIHPVK
ncbi:carboxymuconolactone decarboxylase family protein [Dongia sp.]|uniref:carboxymuconolactone decarboxylase family protein n=1 Tax=Dongia sp. TaxID=1977262 RepID=UPI0035AE06EF